MAAIAAKTTFRRCIFVSEPLRLFSDFVINSFCGQNPRYAHKNISDLYRANNEETKAVWKIIYCYTRNKSCRRFVVFGEIEASFQALAGN